VPTPLHRPLQFVLPLLAALGCGRGSAAKGSSGEEELGPLDARVDEAVRPGGSDRSTTASAAAARRPERRYLLAYAGERCTLFWEQGDRRSEPQPVPCPRELEPGERLRLSDRVCLRESGDSNRQEPVRCPATLMNREKADRVDAGLE
jgi:hypothetical protein